MMDPDDCFQQGWVVKDGVIYLGEDRLLIQANIDSKGRVKDASRWQWHPICQACHLSKTSLALYPAHKVSSRSYIICTIELVLSAIQGEGRIREMFKYTGTDINTVLHKQPFYAAQQQRVSTLLALIWKIPFCKPGYLPGS